MSSTKNESRRTSPKIVQRTCSLTVNGRPASSDSLPVDLSEESSTRGDCMVTESALEDRSGRAARDSDEGGCRGSCRAQPHGARRRVPWLRLMPRVMRCVGKAERERACRVPAYP